MTSQKLKDKQEYIEALQNFRERDTKLIDELRAEIRKQEADRRADAETAKVHARLAEGAAKLAREQEAIDLLKLGYVKVETLRGMILQDYEVGYSGNSATAEMRLRLRSGDRVETALRAALAEGAKPKFATGGYVVTGSSYGTPGIAANLDAVRRSADKLSEGSFRVVWGNDL